MRSLLSVVLCFSALLCAIPEPPVNAQQPNAQFTLTRRAIWAPTDEMVQGAGDKCKSPGVARIEQCFISFMRDSGATHDAIEFARQINGQGYLRDLRKRLGVDVAYVTYPFRANENDAVLLINRNLKIIDVDSADVLNKVDIKSDATYKQLSPKYPNMTILPGDRTSTDQPALEMNTQQGQRFIVRYNVVNGCHACQIVAYALIAFDFTPQGDFIGTEFLGLSDQSSAPVRPRMRFSNPRATIDTRVGEQFSLVLFANHNNGFHWELASPIDPSLLSQVDNTFEPPDADKVVGKEVWTFKVLQKGKTTISVKRVGPRKTPLAADSEVFTIVIN